MKPNHQVDHLNSVLANTYALYLKTQSYHWHVKGVNFYSLHQLFEQQYQALADAIDTLAERIVIVGGQAIADFAKLHQLSVLQTADPNYAAKEMLQDLAEDHEQLLAQLKKALKQVQNSADEVSADLLIARMQWHEKTRWMLKASI